MADYLKIPELARRLDVSEKTARRYVKAGALPSTFIGGAYRVTEVGLEAFLHGAEVKPGGEVHPKAPPELDADDLEDWASGVDNIPELKRAAARLWPLYGQLAGTAGGPVSAEDAGQLAEVGRKLDIINARVTELAPGPLATIVMHPGEPTQAIYHRDPTDEERARLRAEYPDALEVEAKQVALAY